MDFSTPQILPVCVHFAFSKMANPSVPYAISDPNNLRVRLKDSKDILMKGGIAVGVNARRTKSQRQHIFVPFNTTDDLVTLEEKYPDITWMHEEKLVAL